MVDAEMKPELLALRDCLNATNHGLSCANMDRTDLQRAASALPGVRQLLVPPAHATTLCFTVEQACGCVLPGKHHIARRVRRCVRIRQVDGMPRGDDTENCTVSGFRVARIVDATDIIYSIFIVYK